MNTNYSENEERLAEFADLVMGLESIEYESHPSDEILRAYVAQRLPEGRIGETHAFGLHGRVSRWTRSDVSMHVLTCTICQQHVARLRASRWQLLSSARQQPKEEWSWHRRFALGALASAAAAAVIIALWLWPPSPPGPACWIEDQCWQQVVRESPAKGSIMMSYYQSRRF
ncbi:MAG: hypothetical protein K6T71_05720 [Candidatus Bipolaricaulota bacterium]|nr:hypothetical protein [Candidatus Bipolaricaulota bacterium]